jgi:hypothetical protein
MARKLGLRVVTALVTLTAFGAAACGSSTKPDRSSGQTDRSSVSSASSPAAGSPDAVALNWVAHRVGRATGLQVVERRTVSEFITQIAVRDLTVQIAGADARANTIPFYALALMSNGSSWQVTSELEVLTGEDAKYADPLAAEFGPA